MGEFKCPRRDEIGAWDRVTAWGDDVPLPDVWNERGGKSCSYCGSMNPDEFMEQVAAGVELGPTDKSYKVYVGDHGGKFYFQHLSVEQRHRFVELLNAGTLNIGNPHRFYVLPFFVGR